MVLPFIPPSPASGASVSGETPKNGTPEQPQIEQVILAIRTAWRTGRRIVPLVGAGLSADSGIPVIRSLYRYFAKFQQLLKHRAYLPAIDGSKYIHDPMYHYIENFKERPDKFVQAFGWPDRYDLNQDLLVALEDYRPKWTWEADHVPLVQLAVEHGYQDILGILQPDARQSFVSLISRMIAKLSNTKHEKVDQYLWTDDGRYEAFRLFEDWRKLIRTHPVKTVWGFGATTAAQFRRRPLLRRWLLDGDGPRRRGGAR